MIAVPGSDRIVTDQKTNPIDGQVRWAPVKSLWVGTLTVMAVLLGPVFFTWEAFLLFLTTSAITLCFGYSVGMHRRLIHNSFGCPLWLEYICVYLGTLVGMAGPIGMMRFHDFRDWAQRQPRCHDYFCHRRRFWHDSWWQLHCELTLRNPPAFRLEPRVAKDCVYKFLEQTWMWQQLPWAMLFFVIGGWPWLIWGIAVRVAVCVIGHWLVGHFAHRDGGQSWVVRDAAAQGYNVKIAGLFSMGESWHNNHHAFPGSARLGLFPGQIDLGWLLIKAFESIRLAWSIKLPADLPMRKELQRLSGRDEGCPLLERLHALAY